MLSVSDEIHMCGCEREVFATIWWASDHFFPPDSRAMISLKKKKRRLCSRECVWVVSEKIEMGVILKFAWHRVNKACLIPRWKTGQKLWWLDVCVCICVWERTKARDTAPPTLNYPDSASGLDSCSFLQENWFQPKKMLRRSLHCHWFYFILCSANIFPFEIIFWTNPSFSDKANAELNSFKMNPICSKTEQVDEIQLGCFTSQRLFMKKFISLWTIQNNVLSEMEYLWHQKHVHK